MRLYRRNWRNTCLSILLIVVCFMTSLFFLGINANAETIIRTGTVQVSSSLNFRNGPGTEYDVIGYLYNGNTGQIIEEKAATTGTIWYKMNINGKIGWASSNYIKVTETIVKEDEAFDAYLTAQGFPEAYKAQLQALHAKYPNWVFQAQHTNLKWEDVIKAEYALGKNLVHSGADSSWKSTQNGAYDWETGKWVVFDSGGWVAASKEIIEYFMDPRNFLDATSVFQFLRQSYNAEEYNEDGLTQVKAGLTSMVANTFLAGQCDEQSYVDVLMSVAAEKGVSPYVLASMMIQELGVKGDSASISGTVPGYEGYYNYYNIGAFASGDLTAIQKGLTYAKGSGSYDRPWNSRYKAIAGGAEYYASGYVKKGQDTMYLKKFNVQGSNLYGHQYMTNVQGAYSEGKLMSKAYDETARQGSLTFRIPVYLNMPASACAKPLGNGNPNYMLKSLAVTGQSLTPTFSMYETSYSLIVPNEVSSIAVTATTFTDKTTIAGVGTHNLKVGSNAIKVITTAQNGSQRTYTITVVRQEAPVKPPEQNPEVVIPTPSVSTSSYKINSDKTITGITSFPINVTNFKTKFSVSNGNVKIMTAGGTEKAATANVGTGDQIRVYDNAGEHKLTYTVVVYGDTNGDGKVQGVDAMFVQSHVVGKKIMSGAYATAADANRDGKVQGVDAMFVQMQVVGKKQIQQ